MSPLLGDLKGLPPTMMITADLDEFREQEEEYMDKLRKAGVRVRAPQLRPDAAWVLELSGSFRGRDGCGTQGCRRNPESLSS